MQRRPGWSILGASHGTLFALENSGYGLDYIRDYGDFLGINLRTENVQRWKTSDKPDPADPNLVIPGCDYLAAGVNAGIAGFRADIAIIDDPVPGRDEADRESFRTKVWKWFHGDLARRLKPEGRVILMHTRWHEDDLAGRLTKSQPDKWKVLSLPAIALGPDPETGIIPRDILGRDPGAPLWSGDGYGYGESLQAIRAELESEGRVMEWTSLYQQNPRPQEGALFKVKNLLDRIIPESEIPLGTGFVRAWDLAGSSDTGSAQQAFTAGLKLGKTTEGKYIIGHITRDRMPPEKVVERIKETAKLDGHMIRIGLPQDPGQAGKFQVEYLVQQLAGFTVESGPETGDKATRAGPFASQVNAGNVSMVAGPWNQPFIEEARSFPVGVTLDQIDAASRAFSMVYKGGTALWAAIGAMKR